MRDFCKRLLMAGITACMAAEAAAAEKVPTLADILKASEIALIGYIDTSYTNLSGSGLFTSGTPNRVFDTERRSFNLHMVNVMVSSLPASGFGGLVDLNAGSDARVITPVGTTSDEFDITQAYVQYASGAFKIIGGKFVTNSGAEVIKTTDDVNFSRSILFGYAIPFTHTGVRAYFTVNDKLSFIAGINNGWDVVRESVAGNTDKTLELGVTATPIKLLSLVASFYSGKETAAANGQRDLLDLVATYSLSDALSFTLNYDRASQEQAFAGGGEAKWNGIAAYINYKLNDLWRASVRAEEFDDKNGFRTGVAQKWKETTLTLAHLPSKNVELRAEVRYDKSNVSSFVQPGGGTKSSQDSFGLEAIFKF